MILVHCFLLFLSISADKLDDIRSFRKRKRRYSEMEGEEDEEGQLSLTEYLAKKMAEDEKEGPSKKKRVSFIMYRPIFTAYISMRKGS